jgi:hypothetical protein
MAAIGAAGTVVLGTIKDQNEILMEDGFLSKYFMELSNQNFKQGFDTSR